MRPKGSADLLEDRRRRAVELLGEGRTLSDTALLIHCATSSVMRWRNSWRQNGERGLKVRFSPGRPLKLSTSQRRKLVLQLLKGPLAHGYSTDLWTTARIAELIQRHFGVLYHRDHVGRMMQSLGWSHQKPERRAMERNEDAIQEWKRCRWPQVKKTLRGWAPTSFFLMNRGSS